MNIYGIVEAEVVLPTGVVRCKNFPLCLKTYKHNRTRRCLLKHEAECNSVAAPILPRLEAATVVIDPLREEVEFLRREMDQLRAQNQSLTAKLQAISELCIMSLNIANNTHPYS